MVLSVGKVVLSVGNYLIRSKRVFFFNPPPKKKQHHSQISAMASRMVKILHPMVNSIGLSTFLMLVWCSGYSVALCTSPKLQDLAKKWPILAPCRLPYSRIRGWGHIFALQKQHRSQNSSITNVGTIPTSSKVKLIILNTIFTLITYHAEMDLA